MALSYIETTLENIESNFADVHEKFGELRQQFLVRPYKNPRAREFAYNGLARRPGTIHCIDEVFDALPARLEEILRTRNGDGRDDRDPQLVVTGIYRLTRQSGEIGRRAL